MKKVIIILISCLFLFGCNSNKYKEISYDEYIEKINNKEDFILFIGSSECSHCDVYKETLNEVLKDYKVTINYIDISKFNEEQSNKFNADITYTGTPTTVFIKDGKEGSSYTRINGSKSYKYVVEKLKINGYIELDKIESNDEEKEEKPESVNNNKETQTYKEISYNDFINKTNNKEDFVLFIGSHNCSHCDTFKTTLNTLLKKHDVVINYIDVANFTSEQSRVFDSKIDYEFTPTTIFIKSGIEEDTNNRISGAKSENYVVDKLQENGYIEKDE